MDPFPPDRSSPADELVEVVDPTGRVLRLATRREVRDGTLWHRCTYVGVLTSAGELVVHQRADWKDVYPSYWDVCFGGVCGVGEDWETSARRELVEEAGISGVPLIDLGPVTYDADDGHLVGRVFVARHDGPLSCPDGEVVATDLIPLAEIDQWLHGRPVCPDSRQVALPLVRAHASLT